MRYFLLTKAVMLWSSMIGQVLNSQLFSTNVCVLITHWNYGWCDLISSRSLWVHPQYSSFLSSNTGQKTIHFEPRSEFFLVKREGINDYMIRSQEDEAIPGDFMKWHIEVITVPSGTKLLESEGHAVILSLFWILENVILSDPIISFINYSSQTEAVKSICMTLRKCQKEVLCLVRWY